MAAWRYEISFLVLKKYFTSERSERVKYFSTLEEKFHISARPCNILYISLNTFRTRISSTSDTTSNKLIHVSEDLGITELKHVIIG